MSKNLLKSRNLISLEVYFKIMVFKCVVHYPHLKVTKLTRLNEQKLETLKKCKVTRQSLIDHNVHDEQCKTISQKLGTSKHGIHSECYKKFTMGFTVAKRKFSETSQSGSGKRVRRSGTSRSKRQNEKEEE